MPENKPRDYLVGVDLGGTKILAGVFTLKLELIGQAKISTKAHRGVETVIERIAHCIHEVVDECDLSLKQIKAVDGALSKVGSLVLQSHLKHHVVTAHERGDEDRIVEELMEILKYR